MKIALHALVSGKVQGVWYRQSTVEQAVSLGVHGWVRNLPDGRVEAWLEGDEGPVREVARWLEQGPARAEVSGVEMQEKEPQGFAEFEVRHS